MLSVRLVRVGNDKTSLQSAARRVVSRLAATSTIPTILLPLTVLNRSWGLGHFPELLRTYIHSVQN